ncbi:hypothetical protein GQ44DRAFT_769341 [Phaeosphaeriaceae sp. PMI808]|nr:hypothetical protein GQ44DRAFT_769341 [Phaeosphaeriaceae sp. PMI808]
MGNCDSSLNCNKCYSSPPEGGCDDKIAINPDIAGIGVVVAFYSSTLLIVTTIVWGYSKAPLPSQPFTIADCYLIGRRTVDPTPTDPWLWAGSGTWTTCTHITISNGNLEWIKQTLFDELATGPGPTISPMDGEDTLHEEDPKFSTNKAITTGRQAERLNINSNHTDSITSMEAHLSLTPFLKRLVLIWVPKPEHDLQIVCQGNLEEYDDHPYVARKAALHMFILHAFDLGANLQLFLGWSSPDEFHKWFALVWCAFLAPKLLGAAKRVLNRLYFAIEEVKDLQNKSDSGIPSQSAASNRPSSTASAPSSSSPSPQVSQSLRSVQDEVFAAPSRQDTEADIGLLPLIRQATYSYLQA